MENHMEDTYEEDLEQLIESQFTNGGYILKQVMDNWERLRRMCVIQLVCYIVHAMHLLQLQTMIVHELVDDENSRRVHLRQQLMENLLKTNNCRDVIGMSPYAFLHLCEKLRVRGKVKDSIHATLEEQVANFLHILAPNGKNRIVPFPFHRSRETINCHFHNVLRAIIALEDEFLVQPSGSEVPPQILHDSRFYPYFKDCIGAIDGIHMRVKVPIEDVPRFKGKKKYPTQNVFAACSFDMRFTYVLAGWEGSASNSRILKDALTRSGDKLKIPEGKFYLGDARYPLKGGLLTPYKGTRYHLKEYSNCGPENSKEIFNHRHALLRIVIERAFGVLQKRFPIIASDTEPFYPFQTMTRIVIACCILHNFLMDNDPDERLIAEVDHELLHNVTDDSCDYDCQTTKEDYRLGQALRASIVELMRDDFEP